MSKSAAPVIGSVAAMLAIAGTLAVVQLSQPTEPSKPQVQLVQPAAETVTVTPSPTTTADVSVTPSPTTTAAVKPKPAAPKVESSPKATTVQRQAVVSEPAPAPAPETTTSEPAPTAQTNDDGITVITEGGAPDHPRKRVAPPTPAG